MELKITNHDNISVIAINGAIDAKTAPDVRSQIVPLLQPQSRLILDMRGVNYMSSAGLRVLLLLYRQSATQSSRLALVGLAQEVKDVMKVTGFLKFFEIFDTFEAAKAAFG